MWLGLGTLSIEARQLTGTITNQHMRRAAKEQQAHATFHDECTLRGSEHDLEDSADDDKRAYDIYLHIGRSGLDGCAHQRCIHKPIRFV